MRVRKLSRRFLKCSDCETRLRVMSPSCPLNEGRIRVESLRCMGGAATFKSYVL